MSEIHAKWNVKTKPQSNGRKGKQQHFRFISYIRSGIRNNKSKEKRFYSSRWVRNFLVFGLGTTVTNTSTLNGDLLNVGGNCSSLEINWPWPFGAKAREEVFSCDCVKASFDRWLLSANGGVFTVIDCVAEADPFSSSNWLPGVQTKNQELDFAIILNFDFFCGCGLNFWILSDCRTVK